MVLFGSFARGEAAEHSDIDLLIVTEPSVPLGRALYAVWDATSSDATVSPHFVHLPEKVFEAGSRWYEVAIDGVVLFEKGRLITGFLRTVRKAIADRLIERKDAYGHGYWIKHESGVAHVQCAESRLAAVQVLMEHRSWADVVRESQEIVEITLKALLRAFRIEVPRIHDVSPVIEQNRERLAPAVGKSIDEMMKISRALRRDRERSCPRVGSRRPMM